MYFEFVLKKKYMYFEYFKNICLTITVTIYYFQQQNLYILRLNIFELLVK